MAQRAPVVALKCGNLGEAFVNSKRPSQWSSGSPFELHFDTQPAAEPKSPVVIPFSITVVPKGEEMDLHVATAKLQVQVWTWGVAP